MPGALVLALVFHRLVFVTGVDDTPGLARRTAAGRAALAAPEVPARVARARRDDRGARCARCPARPLGSALLLPQAATLYLTALYNFAITGSVRPDALFLAWGPAGVTSARTGPGAARAPLRRPLRHPAVRSRLPAGGRGPPARRSAPLRPRAPRGRRLLPDRGLRRQLGGRGLEPRPLLHAARAARRRLDRHRARPRRLPARGARPRPDARGMDGRPRRGPLARSPRRQRLRRPPREEHVRRREPVRPQPPPPAVERRGARPLGARGRLDPGAAAVAAFAVRSARGRAGALAGKDARRHWPPSCSPPRSCWSAGPPPKPPPASTRRSRSGTERPSSSTGR